MNTEYKTIKTGYSADRSAVSVFRCALFMAVLCCMSTPSNSEILVASNNFDASLHGWYSVDDWASVANPGSGGADAGWMSTTWTNLSGPDLGEAWWSDKFVTRATNLFAGNFDTNMYFSMDFWASNNAPEAVQVIWGTDETTNRIWANTVFDDSVDDMSMQAWTGFRTDALIDKTDWGMPFWTQQDFIDDLASLDWVGIEIWRGDMAADIYGIDNFNLMVPEPAEILLLLFAGMSSFMTLRRKRKGSIVVELESVDA